MFFKENEVVLTAKIVGNAKSLNRRSFKFIQIFCPNFTITCASKTIGKFCTWRMDM